MPVEYVITVRRMYDNTVLYNAGSFSCIEDSVNGMIDAIDAISNPSLFFNELKLAKMSITYDPILSSFMYENLLNACYVNEKNIFLKFWDTLDNGTALNELFFPIHRIMLRCGKLVKVHSEKHTDGIFSVASSRMSGGRFLFDNTGHCTFEENLDEIQ